MSWQDPQYDQVGEVASAMGVAVARRDIGCGRHAVAHLLEDGRVLKVTTSAYDAAAALAVMRHQGPLHPGVVRAHAVARLACGALPDHFAIILDHAQVARASEDLADALDALNDAWTFGGKRPRAPGRLAARLGGEERAVLEAFLDTIHWMRREVGVTLRDLKAENLARTRQGGIGSFDHGDSLVPADCYEAVLGGLVPTLAAPRALAPGRR